MGTWVQAFVSELSSKAGVTLQFRELRGPAQGDAFVYLDPGISAETQLVLLVLDGRIADCTTPLGDGFYELISDDDAYLSDCDRPGAHLALNSDEQIVWGACLNMMKFGAVKWRQRSWSIFSRTSFVSSQTIFNSDKTRVKLSPTGPERYVAKIFPSWSALQSRERVLNQ